MQMAYLALRRVELGFWQVVVMNALRLALVVFFVSIGAVGIAAAIAVAMLVAEAIGMFVFMPRLAKGFRPRLRWSTEVTGTLVPYSIANYLADLLYRAPLLLAPPLALERLGAASSAHAYVAWMIGSILASPGLSLATSAFAEGSHAPSDLRQTLLRAGRYAAMFTLPIALLTFAGASWILAIFGQSYADEGAALLRWLALTAPLMVFVGLYFSALRVRKRIRELILLSGLISATTLAIPLLAIDRFGLSSMGGGWLVGHALVAIFAGWRLLRRRDFIYPETEKVGLEK
jgi:O-antigen/teichoic acid export membrane protein